MNMDQKMMKMILPDHDSAWERQSLCMHCQGVVDRLCEVYRSKVRMFSFLIFLIGLSHDNQVQFPYSNFSLSVLSPRAGRAGVTFMNNHPEVRTAFVFTTLKILQKIGKSKDEPKEYVLSYPLSCMSIWGINVFQLIFFCYNIFRPRAITTNY